MKFKSTKPKFRNKKTPDGFRSQFESQISKQLKRKRNAKVTYESHSISYSIPRVYNPDFTVLLPNGRMFYLEVKGWFRQEDKVKMKYVKICNPTLDIRFVFPRLNKKDVAWCLKNNYPYCIGQVPKDWFNG